MGSIIIFILGMLFGGVIISLGCVLLVMGTVYIEMSDGDGPFLFLELSKDINVLTTKKYVILKVSKRLLPPK